MEQLTDIQKQILNGHLLGDGCLTKPKICSGSNAFFQINRTIRDHIYLMWSVYHFQNFIYENGVSTKKCFKPKYNKEYYFSSLATKNDQIFTEYYHQWYPNNKKIIPSDLILTPLTIAVWFADDGYARYSNGSSGLMFATQGFSSSEVDFLSQQLQNKYGLKIRMVNDKDKFIIASHHSPTINKLLNDIYPVFPPLRRKFDNISKSPLINIPEIPDDFIPSPINFYVTPEKIWPECGGCKSNHNVIKYGKNELGKQRYFCESCKKIYLDMNDYTISAANE
jgi:hypothetical protein